MEEKGLAEENVDTIITTAIKELEDIKDQLEQCGPARIQTVRSEEQPENLKYAVWANTYAVSARVASIISKATNPIDWFKEELKDQLKKYVSKLRATMETVVKELGALSYSISIGFPFSISVSITWPTSPKASPGLGL